MLGQGCVAVIYWKCPVKDVVRIRIISETKVQTYHFYAAAT